MGASPRSLPMDSSVYRQAILQSKSGLGSAGVITLPPSSCYFKFLLFMV